MISFGVLPKFKLAKLLQDNIGVPFGTDDHVIGFVAGIELLFHILLEDLLTWYSFIWLKMFNLTR